jgi:biopolymer transport protein ExbB/TolQ
LIIATSLGDQITQAVNEVAKALRYPVLIVAMIALVIVVWEVFRLLVEAFRRAQRPKTPFEQTARQAIAQKAAGDTAAAQATLQGYSYGAAMQKAAVGTLFAADPIDAQRAVVDYDLYVSKRLDRVRLLVRAGPALGLMGTLIPLAPALAALGKGQPDVLADELQTAFAITVVGVLVGLVAFTVALIRERYYTRDLADLEFLREVRGDAAVLTPASVPQPSAAAPAHTAATDQPVAASAATAAETVAMPQSVPQSAATPPTAQPSPPAFPPPATAPKKKFGLKKKSKPAASPPAFPPPPPAPTVPPAAQPAKKPEDGPGKLPVDGPDKKAD